MGFFDMGLPEILLVLIVALIIWGPGKLPEIARTVGKTVRALRRTTSDLTATITREIDLDEKDSPPRSKANSDVTTRESSDAGKTESGDTGGG